MAADPKPKRNIILSSQVAQALAVIGDRWAMLVIRDVFLGFRRFEDLRERSGAARGTLASRLKRLVANGILYRNPYQSSPRRYEYRLTDKGLDLYPIVLTTWSWETKWGGDYGLPPALIHKRCGNTMAPRFVCAECRRPIEIYDVRYTAGIADPAAAAIPPRFQRRSKKRDEPGEEVDARFFHILDIIGDRWTGLVTAAAYFGLQRFDDIAKGIGIATNILADRLKLLVDQGVFERRAYRQRPQRYEYVLTEKGRDLYKVSLAMHEWANRWIIRDGPKPLILHHKPCGSELKLETVCGECGEELAPGDVSFEREERQAKSG